MGGCIRVLLCVTVCMGVCTHVLLCVCVAGCDRVCVSTHVLLCVGVCECGCCVCECVYM